MPLKSICKEINKVLSFKAMSFKNLVKQLLEIEPENFNILKI
jgi:hypothetical protein